MKKTSEAMYTFWISYCMISCILFNTILMTLHEQEWVGRWVWRCIRWFSQFYLQNTRLANDWDALQIYNPDHQNAKQVFSTMMLWRKTQSKKMMRYLNKQIFWMERVVLPPYWRESLHIATLITLMRNPNPYSCIWT